MRAVLSGVLLVLSVVLTTPAVVSTWARAEVVETDRFVTTLAPLAEEPAVQQMLTDQVLAAIEAEVDLSGLGITLDSWNLPPSATELLEDLAGTAAEKARSLIEASVQRVVSSQTFANIWSALLEQAHTSAVAVLEGDPGSKVRVDEHGALWLELGPVVEQVKSDLIDHGVQFASAIPQIDHSIQLLTSDSVSSARFWYQLSTTLGAWLPWILLGLTVAGVAMARKRGSALARTALGWAAMLGVLLLALWGVRRGFIDEVSPQISAAAAGTIFDQVTVNLRSSTALLLGLAVALALASWLIGRLVSSGRARA